MNQAETNVLKAFRRFRIQPHQMLFFNPGQTKSQAAQFRRTIQSMIERGYIVQERHRDAYSLTSRGYEISLRCDVSPPAPKPVAKAGSSKPVNRAVQSLTNHSRMPSKAMQAQTMPAKQPAAAAAGAVRRESMKSRVAAKSAVAKKATAKVRPR
jgi:hypothetical protein